MKISSSFTLRSFVVSMCFAGFISVTAAETPKEVGKVIDIDGPRLYTNRLRQDKSWYQSFTGMKTYLAERLRTDKETRAVLDFAIGGQAGIDRNTVVQIVSDSGVSKTSNSMRIDAGRMWAKLDKQEKPLEIRTAGGVIGIEGTELLIGVDAEKGTTEVLLFEGQVSVTDDKGNKTTMHPGDYAEFGGARSMCILSYPPSSLRTLVVERFPTFSSFIATQNVTSIPNPASPTLVRGFNKIRPDLLTVWKTSQEATGSAAGGLSPNQSSAGGGPPTFRWQAVPGASEYALFVSSDQAGEDMVFSSRSEGTSVSIPDGAQGLPAGKYFWSVVPLNAEGEPVGKPATTWFETSGWEATGVTLEDLPGTQAQEQ